MPESRRTLDAGAAGQALQDERHAARLRVALPVRYTITQDHRHVSGSCRTVNISGGGVQMTISKALQTPATCQITLDLPNSTSLTLEGQIRWCRGAVRNRRVGVQFIKTRRNEHMFSSYCRFVATTLFNRYYKAPYTR